MSFLLTRGISHVNKLTKDPASEAEYRKQQAATKETIRGIRKGVNSERNILSIGLTKKLIFEEDAAVLKAVLDEVDKYLDGAETYTSTDIADYASDRFNNDKYYALARTSFQAAGYEKASAERYTLRMYMNLAKQTKHDNADLDPNIIKAIDAYITIVQKFLDDNVYSRADIYVVFIQQTSQDNQNAFNSLPEKTQSDKDKKTKIQKAFLASLTKLQKNNNHIDYEENGKPSYAPWTGQQAARDAEHFKSDALNDTFSPGRLFGNAISHTLSIAFILMILFVLGLGSSMAVNLNVYKPVHYRVMYAIWGFFFGWIVLPYVIGYRWLWKGKTPRFYAFIPLIPRFFLNKYVQFLLGWMTYKPDELIWELEEWRNTHPHA